MKKSTVIAALLLALSCAFCAGCNAGDTTQSGKESKNMQETIDSILFAPGNKLSLEEYASSLSELCQNAKGGYEQLMLAAKNKSAPAKGIKAAKKVEEKYKARLDELCSMDFSACTEEEISGYYREVSTIITAVREANDLMNR